MPEQTTTPPQGGISPVRQARAHLGAAVRWSAGPEAIIKARQDLAYARLEQTIEEALADAVPPTWDQRKNLAKMLLGYADA